LKAFPSHRWCLSYRARKLYLCGVRYIALRSVGYDNVDLKKRSSRHQSNVPVLALFSSWTCGRIIIGIESKDYRSKLLCKWATTVWIIWWVLTIWKNSGDYWNR
jgi:hypothetical protein